MGQGEQANAGGTDARSKHGDALRIAPKVADVLADPAQALDLVQQPIVPLGGLVTCAQEAWKTTRGESHSHGRMTERANYSVCGPFFNFEILPEKSMKCIDSSYVTFQKITDT